MNQLLMLALSFLKIGVFGFGGGLAIIALIYQEAEKFGISSDVMAQLVAISQVTPGPMAVNTATYVGFDVAGLPGAVTATLTVGLPGFILVILAVVFIRRFKDSRIMKGILRGIRPAACGLIFAAALIVASGTVISWPVDITAVIIFGAAIFLSLKFKVNPLILMLISGVAGAVIYGLVI